MMCRNTFGHSLKYQRHVAINTVVLPAPADIVGRVHIVEKLKNGGVDGRVQRCRRMGHRCIND